MKSALAMAHRPMPRGRPNASFRGPRGGDDDDDEPTPAAPALAADSSEERRDAGVSGGDDQNAAASDSEQEHAPTPKVRLDLAAHALDGEVGAARDKLLGLLDHWFDDDAAAHSAAERPSSAAREVAVGRILEGLARGARRAAEGLQEADLDAQRLALRTQQRAMDDKMKLQRAASKMELENTTAVLEAAHARDVAARLSELREQLDAEAGDAEGLLAALNAEIVCIVGAISGFACDPVSHVDIGFLW